MTVSQEKPRQPLNGYQPQQPRNSLLKLHNLLCWIFIGILFPLIKNRAAALIDGKKPREKAGRVVFRESGKGSAAQKHFIRISSALLQQTTVSISHKRAFQ